MQKFALSDLLLLNELTVDSTGKVISSLPRVKSNFPKKEGDFYIQFELFSLQFPEQAELTVELRDEKDRLELDSTMVVEVQDLVTPFYFDIAKYQLKKNNYTCVVKAKAGKLKSESHKKISFFWVTLPESSEDITTAINQMRYILPTDSLDRYVEAPLTDQQKFFSGFWARRDPNPNTKVNELMDEYFSRINYAEREFSNFSSRGWLSDRGRILIKFGHPDDIELKERFLRQVNQFGFGYRDKPAYQFLRCVSRINSLELHQYAVFVNPYRLDNKEVGCLAFKEYFI